MNVKTIGRVFRLSSAILILYCALAVFGCNRGQDSAGKYLYETNHQNYTELKSDGTFTVHQGTVDANGKYAITGKQLKLSLSTGEVLIGSIEGRTITDNEGKLWTKQ
ncbi:MAG TPA: hypothetical protein VN642_06455 [Dongiaceae bacterium]|nr:hypothetical protein [Dongiaceae bacterium]